MLCKTLSPLAKIHMTKTVLITGATGFLGSYLVRGMLDSGYKILAYKRKESTLWRLADICEKVQWFDSTDELEFPFRNNQINHVIHTAVCYGRGNEKISSVIEANILFPAKLLELCVLNKVKTFFNTDTFFTKKTNEDYNYLQSYSLCKKQFCEWLKLVQVNLKVINIKLEHSYGPKDAETKFIPSIISNCLKNVSEIKLTRGEQKRDFIFVDDVVKAYLCLLENCDFLQKNYTEIPVGSGKKTTLHDLVERIATLTKTSSKLLFGALPYNENEIMESVADTSFLQRFGWSADYKLEQGLLNTISYYKKILL
jgi:CDP-paratose synthetase